MQALFFNIVIYQKHPLLRVVVVFFNSTGTFEAEPLPFKIYTFTLILIDKYIHNTLFG